MIKILYIIGLSITSGILYYIAGKGGFKNAKAIRRFGCPFVRHITLIILFWDKSLWLYWQFYLSYALSVIGIWGYWDWLTRLWRGDESEYFENWLLHGWGCGFALLPLAWCNLSIFWISINAILMGLLMMWVSERSGNNVTEEIGRGIIFNL